MPRLILNPGAEDTQTFDLQPGTYEVGRDPDNTICIPDDSLSSRHCKITLDETGVTLTDLHSSNGSFVDEVRVTQTALMHGQRIRLGHHEFLFEDTPATDAAVHPPVKPRKRVRIALPSQPQAEVSNTIHLERSEPAPLPAGNEKPVFAGDTCCRYHPHSFAQFYCQKCRKYFCDLCVAARPVEGQPAHCCRTCGQPCQPVTTAAAPAVQEAFGTLAARAFRYPFERGGTFLVVTGTLFLLFLDIASWVVSFAWIMGLAALLVLSLVGGGYLFAFVKSVVSATAQGSDTLPDWPDISDVSEEVVMPFFQNLGMMAFCFGPGLALMGYGGVNENPSIVLGGGILLFLGLCYLPMALLGIAMFDSVAGLNPVLGIPSIVQTAGHYLLTLLVFFVILGMGAGLDFLFSELIDVPLLPSVVSAFFTFYSMLVLARTLGLLYRVNEDSLGWFKPRPR